MANILLHTLLFAPDGNSNAYIFSDIALELQKRGHKVTVITTTPHYSVLQENINRQPFRNGEKAWYKRSEYNGIPCYHIEVPSEKGGLKNRLTAYIKFHWHAFRLAKYGNIIADVVIAQSPPLSIGLVSAMMAKKKKSKAVYVIQDLFPDGLITQGKIKNKFIIKALRILEKTVYKRSDVVIAISDGIKEHLRGRIPAGKILKVIPNFVDTDIYHPLPRENEIAERFNVKDKFVVSYVGNIGNAQDLSPILFCAKELKDLNIEFIIAGSGIRREYFENEAVEQQLDNVKFVGYQKREDTPYINALSDVCLVLLAPHIKSFSFPSKIYTLMAMAKPIIAVCSSESNVAQFINETKSGWAVESGHNEEFTMLVKELYHNRELLEQYSSNSLKAVEDGYTKEAVGMQYDKLIKEICK